MVNSPATKNQYTPRTVSHPGVTLSAKIQEMGMSIREFALRTAKPEKTILAVIRGDSSITADMAVIFENVTMIPAHFWIARQRNYDEFLAQSRMAKRIETSSAWADSFPAELMVKYGWIQPFTDLSSKTKSLLRFFAVTSADAWENYYINQQLKVAFRISLRSTSNPYAISAWLRQGDRQATAIVLSEKYSDKKLRQYILNMKRLMVNKPDNWSVQLQELCALCGIKLVYTQSLPEAPINGATRWLASRYPCIQMSCDEKRYDTFWFSFFHEIGHILLHGKKDFFLENIDYDNKENDKEMEADNFSANLLLSQSQEKQIVSTGDFSAESIMKYAESFGTHPLIIIGRLRYLHLVSEDYYTRFLELVS
ncbi:MAG: ImmA/IrrE family metallo-endopeptidase [Muribaculaceae bacterium]|nr:ImmA/IrrE family metallo-endopeptidase [Muribaculaceae bacterium]